MKTRRILSILVLVALATLTVLTGCMVSGGGGSLAIQFGAAAKALTGDETTYRVDVYYGRDLFESQEQIGEGQITFDALPIGLATVYVAAGTGTGDTFVASRFAVKELNIVAGDNQPTGLTLAAVDFVTDTSEGAATSVVGLDGIVYAYTDQGLQSGSIGSLVAGPSVGDMTDVTLSVGSYFDGDNLSEPKQEVWVNGSWDPNPSIPGRSGGIVPWDGTLNDGFVDGFDRNLGVGQNWDGVPTAFTVMGSGSFFVDHATDDNQDGLAIFYQRNGGIGGVFINRSDDGDAANWPWIMDQIDLAAELSDVLPAGEEPVVDFEVGNDALYVVTSFTTLKVSETALTDDEFGGEDFFDSEYIGFASGIPTAVTSIGLDVQNGVAYLGTGDGLWSGNTSADPNIFFDGSPAAVAGTAGYSIGTIAVSGDGDVAFITSREGSPDALAVLTVGGTLATYRTLEGLPGQTLNDLAWLDADTLLVAGSGGLASLHLP